MVTLPKISDYSSDEIKSLSQFSSVFDHYNRQTKRKTCDFSQDVRVQKHRDWIKCALASHAGTISAEKVCLAWSQSTDLILKKVWNHFELDQFDVALIAMGKLGSRELNLSSDIDIVFVASNETSLQEVNPRLKKFIQCLSEVTDFGFAYRVDLNLRPGGAKAPMTSSKTQFFSFYDEYLEAWHRLSFIRMRAISGSAELIEDIQKYCQRNAFPRRLDFSVVKEIKEIRSKINYQWHKANEPFDLKFSPGGIRDIELYVQALQVIYGGKDQNLQVSSFREALKKLSDRSIISNEDFLFLSKFYWELRQIENLLHIMDDQHTYLIKDSFFEKELPKRWEKGSVLSQLEKANEVVSDFFDSSPRLPGSSDLNLESLSENSKKAIDQIQGLKSQSIKRHKLSSTKEEILKKFIDQTDQISIDQELAISSFRDFIFAIKSKSSIFHLLHRHPALIEDLAWLFSISPFVGQILSRRPELVDSFALGQVDINLNSDFEIFLENLGDFKLLGQLFAIIDLFKKKNISTYCQQLTQQADFIVSQLQLYLEKLVPESHDLDIICLGKWSGYEMGIQSDLDFIFLSEQDPSAGQLKLARRLINNLTQNTKAGRLYNIDLRLKPNESAGPLVLKKESLEHFLSTKAKSWQKQAYLRSRRLSDKSYFFQDNFSSLRLSRNESSDLSKIHNKLIQTNRENVIDVKNGSGGIIHTEFLIQKHVLYQNQVPQSPNTLKLIEVLDTDGSTKKRLAQNYQQLRLFEQAFQICNESPSTKVSKKNSHLVRITSLLDVDDFFESLARLVLEQQQLLNSLDLNN